MYKSPDAAFIFFDDGFSMRVSLRSISMLATGDVKKSPRSRSRRWNKARLSSASCKRPTTSGSPIGRWTRRRDRASAWAAQRNLISRSGTFSCADCTDWRWCRSKIRARPFLRPDRGRPPRVSSSSWTCRGCCRKGCPWGCRIWSTPGWSASSGSPRPRSPPGDRVASTWAPSASAGSYSQLKNSQRFLFRLSHLVFFCVSHGKSRGKAAPRENGRRENRAFRNLDKAFFPFPTFALSVLPFLCYLLGYLWREHPAERVY